jgi:hypothetical protein
VVEVTFLEAPWVLAGVLGVDDFIPSDPIDSALSPNYCVSLQFDSSEHKFHLAAFQLDVCVERGFQVQRLKWR